MELRYYFRCPKCNDILFGVYSGQGQVCHRRNCGQMAVVETKVLRVYWSSYNMMGSNLGTKNGKNGWI